MGRLRVYDTDITAHKIARVGKMHVCNTCHVSMPTFHDMLVHTNAKDFFVHMDQVDAVRAENVEESVEASNEVNMDIGVEEDERRVKASKENDDDEAAETSDSSTNQKV